MALIFCAQCGSQIPVSALTCEECGSPVDLTRYERGQAAEIWKWKHREPGILSQAVNAVSDPIARLINRGIPEEVVEKVLDALLRFVDKIMNHKDILKAARARSIQDLRDFSLQENDVIADQIHNAAVGQAIGEGAITGAAGIFGIIPDIPLLCTIALRTVFRVGLSYGFDMKTETDKQLAYAILAQVSANSIREKVSVHHEA